jgi:hypothetical protein
MAAKRDHIFDLVDKWRKERPGQPFIPELSRASSYLPGELRSTPLREIRSCLAECESKKAALETEFPHLKTVQKPFSERQEHWEYNVCTELIPYLRQEISRRARTGTQANEISTANDSASAAQPKFTHLHDYRSVSLFGKQYVLTKQQAQMIKILHKAYLSGNTDVSGDHILEQTSGSRWQDTWKSNRQARKALIAFGATRGTLRLNL